MSNSKNKLMLGILILSVFVFITSVSYAVWQMTLEQTDTNILTTACFKIEFQDENPINLEKAYPITDEEGKTLVPYEFTITNTCDSYATYQINFEILNTTTLNYFEYIATSLNEKSPSVLTNFEEVQPTLHEAIRSYKLETGYFDKNETKTFALRIWLDEGTPASEEFMNKVLESKVTIITSFLPESPSFSERIVECSKNGYNTADCMLENSKYDTVNLSYDETIDNNLRYIGASPNNYVWFNEELWRVIGVMNNVLDSEGNTDSRIKLIRDESIGSYSWDTSASNINAGRGVNEWSEADIMKLLNPGYEGEAVGGSLYWNKENGNCYNGKNNAITPCDFTNTGLLNETKSMIKEVVWNTGSNEPVSVDPDIKASQFYELERSNNIGKVCSESAYCNDTVIRTTKWTGYIGLIYPSDYGFATSGGNTVSRDTCLNTILRIWNNSIDCYNNDWIFKPNITQRTIMPCALTVTTDTAFHVFSTGHIAGYQGIGLAHDIFPSLYLKSNAQIVSGAGTSTDPYELHLINEN